MQAVDSKIEAVQRYFKKHFAGCMFSSSFDPTNNNYEFDILCSQNSFKLLASHAFFEGRNPGEIFAFFDQNQIAAMLRLHPEKIPIITSPYRRIEKADKINKYN
jgi:hypothetical protein